MMCGYHTKEYHYNMGFVPFVQALIQEILTMQISATQARATLYALFGDR